MLLLNMNRSYESPTSSPPTPPSPLPVSFAPGNRKYSFSVSSSPSPPFSPEPSSRDSAEPPEKLPLLEEHLHDATTNVPAAVFSLDRQSSQELEPKSTCLKDLLEWFIQRCCNCCTRFIEISQGDITSHETKNREKEAVFKL